jgi:predicted GNAT family N-acyltransferase
VRAPSVSVHSLHEALSKTLGFYEKLGFVAIDAPYLDAGIDHQDMVLIF